MPFKKYDSYFVDSTFMDKCDHSTVSLAITKVLHDYEVQSKNVISFTTDNATFMLKAFNKALTNFFANSVHITYLSHICSLISNFIKKLFDEVNNFILYFSRVFYMAGSCKRWYLKFLIEKMLKSSNQVPKSLLHLVKFKV